MTIISVKTISDTRNWGKLNTAILFEEPIALPHWALKDMEHSSHKGKTELDNF